MTEDPGDPLDILVEECAEVIQAAMKVRRFGGSGNLERLVQECGDVVFSIDRLIRVAKLFTEDQLTSAVEAKQLRFEGFFGPDR